MSLSTYAIFTSEFRKMFFPFNESKKDVWFQWKDWFFTKHRKYFKDWIATMLQRNHR